MCLYVVLPNGYVYAPVSIFLFFQNQEILVDLFSWDKEEWEL